MTIDLASLQSRDGARRVFAGPGGALGHDNGSSVLFLDERSLEHIGGEAEWKALVREGL